MAASPQYTKKIGVPFKIKVWTLPSDQGGFIGIAKHNGVIGYFVSDGSRIIVTRQNLAFDPHLYPFLQKPLSAPAWQTFHNLTQAAAQGNTQQMIPLPDAPEAPE